MRYKYIIQHPEILGGALTIRGTRIPVSLVLECFAAGMTIDDIVEQYPGLPSQAIPEIFKFAADLAANVDHSRPSAL
jgi:uncharacterized protein (DUF433 family)